jgi:hypothetical protein
MEKKVAQKAISSKRTRKIFVKRQSSERVSPKKAHTSKILGPKIEFIL